MSIPTPPAHMSAASTPLPQPSAMGNPIISSKIDIHSPLPNPSTFDILPVLHELVSRVILSENANGARATSNATASVMYPSQQPISISQLAAEVSTIRTRVRKARAAIEALPDIDMDLQEQEHDIEQLKDRIKKQKQVLRKLYIKQ